MSGYFRAQPRYQTSFFKMRALIAGLGGLVAMLCSALYYLSQTPANSAGTDPAQIAALAHAEAPSMVNVLVANRRIEVGVRLDRSMFDLQSYNLERIPPGVITVNTAAAIDGRYANNLIPAGFPVVQEDVTDQVPLHLLPIPAGFRAITIEATSRELVEGFVVPNSRVDVLWKYTASSGREKVKTLIPFAKVLSVGGKNDPRDRSNVGQGPTTVSLLVKAQDAMKVELARSKGSLSLALLGITATESLDPDSVPLDESDITGGDGEEPREGSVFEYTDPRTGDLIRLCLKGKRWRRDACEDNSEV